jgi:hypothetical protein
MMRHVRPWALTAFLVVVAAACGRGNDSGKLTEVQRVRSGMLDVVLLSPRDAIHHGKDIFAIEFRSAPGGTLVDVGTVTGKATMPMAGMPMLGSIDVARTNVPGRYEAHSDLSMAGTWRMAIEWSGPTGQGSVTFAWTVQLRAIATSPFRRYHAADHRWSTVRPRVIHNVALSIATLMSIHDAAHTQDGSRKSRAIVAASDWPRSIRNRTRMSFRLRDVPQR